jgi:hypothetical protein
MFSTHLSLVLPSSLVPSVIPAASLLINNIISVVYLAVLLVPQTFGCPMSGEIIIIIWKRRR